MRGGITRVSAACPRVRITDVDYNREEELYLWKEAEKQNSVLVVFPEMSKIGYTAKDTIMNKTLLNAAVDSLGWLLENGKDLKTVALIGMPLEYENGIFNCAVAIQGGKILAIVPKSYLPTYGEFEEARWFTPGRYIRPGKTIEILGQTVPIGTDILLEAKNIPNCRIGIEICEDMWVPVPPHVFQVCAGATIIANLSASDYTVGKEVIRKRLIEGASDGGKCIYIYTAAGPGEASELAWDNQTEICENGTIIAEGKRFSREPVLLTTDIDLEFLMHERQITGTFADCADANHKEFRVISFEAVDQEKDKTLMKQISQYPFIPSDPAELNKRCWSVFEIQTNSLQTRLERKQGKKIVLGLSGGLDSTMAALAAVNTLDNMGLSRENLICVTMPGLGTTPKTKSNAVKLAKLLGATLMELPISKVSHEVLRMVGHKGAKNTKTVEEMMERLRENSAFADTTFENVQARVRTLMLMTIANKEHGLVLGTGDLSEKALGWCTYNGDHISMFDINQGIPKTFMQYLVKWVAREKVDKWNIKRGSELRKILISIADTVISPELKPASADGQITQSTEESVGPYKLNDFFLYYFVRHGATTQKIIDLAAIAFKDEYDIFTIRRWMRQFYTRFITQQFKRNATADGPKIGVVDLSPRGSFRMPADVSISIWVKEVDEYVEAA